MKNLENLGLIPVIKEVIGRGIPFLGICVGTQILLERSEEDGGTACLGLFPGSVPRFKPTIFWDKIPQIGWNQVAFTHAHPLLQGIKDGTEFYFVHSYYPAPAAEDIIFGKTEYAGVTFASILGRKNVFATQFHAEKSGRAGLRILENFSRWDGTC
jgi:glutamine amidotransferase